MWSKKKVDEWLRESPLRAGAVAKKKFENDETNPRRNS
jgi:hypothetical protein